MYKVKLSPEEALETIKLRMKYDSSKTLNENVNLIQEQDLEKDVETVKNELGAMFNTDEQEVVDILKKYNTSGKFNQFLSKFKEITKKDLGAAFGNSFAPASDKTEWNGPRTTKAWATYKDEYLKKTPTVTPTPTGNPDLEVDDKDASLDQPF